MEKRRRCTTQSRALFEELVSDASCAEKIELLYFTDIGPELTDPRSHSSTAAERKVRALLLHHNTDEFLPNVPGMVSLESLETELADVTDDGMQYVAQCSNLRKLVLYGGRPGVGNVGLAELEGHEKLETLELINTSVTDDGLVSLTKMPKLTSLVLFWEANRGKRLTDEGLQHLNSMAQLETLELTGGWVSENAANELRSLLTGCKIKTTGLR